MRSRISLRHLPAPGRDVKIGEVNQLSSAQSNNTPTTVDPGSLKTTGSGLQYAVLTEGSGAAARRGSG